MGNRFNMTSKFHKMGSYCRNIVFGIMVCVLIRYSVKIYHPPDKVQTIRSPITITHASLKPTHSIVPKDNNIKNDTDTSEHDLCSTEYFKRHSQSILFNQGKADIFFLETSCSSSVSALQSCAIESACFHNPRALVALKTLSINLDNEGPFYKLLKTLPNFSFHYLDPWNFVKGTPLQAWFQSGKWDMGGNDSSSRIKRAPDLANAFRYLHLYYEGGLYLDSDLIIVSPLDKLIRRNVVGKQVNAKTIESAFLSIASPKAPFIKAAFEPYYAKVFKGNMNRQSGRNGPYLLTNIIELSECSKFLNQSGHCDLYNLTIMPSQAVYHALPTEISYFYHPALLNEIKGLIKNSYMVHIMKQLKTNFVSMLKENMLLQYLSEENCPKTYKLLKDME